MPVDFYYLEIQDFNYENINVEGFSFIPFDVIPENLFEDYVAFLNESYLNTIGLEGDSTTIEIENQQISFRSPNKIYNTILAFNHENQIVGYLNSQVFCEGPNIVDLFHLFVKTEYQRRQIGRKILMEVIQNAINVRNDIEFRVQVADTNENAIGLIESFGFRKRN